MYSVSIINPKTILHRGSRPHLLPSVLLYSVGTLRQKSKVLSGFIFGAWRKQKVHQCVLWQSWKNIYISRLVQARKWWVGKAGQSPNPPDSDESTCLLCCLTCFSFFSFLFFVLFILLLGLTSTRRSPNRYDDQLQRVKLGRRVLLNSCG